MIRQYTPTLPSLRCKAHWQNAQSQRYAQILPKSLPARRIPTHGQKDDAAKMKDNLTGKMNNETLTRGIKHWGLSGYSSFLPRIKFGVTGQESSPQSPTFHTATVTAKQKKQLCGD
jgi:hypothetical protein